MRITEFGGLIPRLLDRNAPLGTAVIAENVDLSQGSLKPIRSPARVEELTGHSLHVEDCCYTQGDCNTSFANHGLGCNEIVVATNHPDFHVIWALLLQLLLVKSKMILQERIAVTSTLLLEK